MAIVILGESECAICGEVLAEGQDIRGIPNFVLNDNHEFTTLSGRVIHADCFSSHPLASRIREQLSIRDNKIGPHNRVCDICGGTINGPDEFFMIDFLSDDVYDPIHKFNFVQMHWPDCLQSWNSRETLVELLGKRLESGEWKGNGAEYLYKTLTGLELPN